MKPIVVTCSKGEVSYAVNESFSHHEECFTPQIYIQLLDYTSIPDNLLEEIIYMFENYVLQHIIGGVKTE